MESNLVYSLDYGERVTSTYAELYMTDDYCDKYKSKKATPNAENKLNEKSKIDNLEQEEKWVSPSDLLIGILELKPPFTSKVTRGKTHEGILSIGNEVFNNEYVQFMRLLTQLTHENDAAWTHILEHEKASVKKKVKEIYGKIFADKCLVMKKEIDIFYEKTLQELEDTLKKQINNILINAHANIVSDLNNEIKVKLNREKIALEQKLKKRYDSEVAKIKHYYKLLLRNEIHRNDKLVNQAISDKNDALKAFYRQIEAENITSTLYIMCLERKKCKIKQFILENYQSIELAEKCKQMKERQDIIEAFEKRDVRIADINKDWEERIKKILQIFIKFISFSLKLLPEQTTFLLNLEKMVILQLNEIKKAPKKATSILVDEEQIKNIFNFKEAEKEEDVCENEPFVIIGDLSDPIPPHYGSRETLPPEVELPVIRLQRQYVYARCHGYEQIKSLFKRCKCSEPTSPKTSKASVTKISEGSEKVDLPPSRESSNELLLLDDIQRLRECPMRCGKAWAKNVFPYLDSYLDFSEENYKRIQIVLGKIPTRDPISELMDPKRIVFADLPFAATKEPYHTVETQYSSQEDMTSFTDIECPCIDDAIPFKPKESSHNFKESPEKALNTILAKRKRSLRNILQEHPNLLKFFTDESFDFVM